MALSKVTLRSILGIDIDSNDIEPLKACYK